MPGLSLPIPFSPFLINLMVSVDGKHHVYFLTLFCVSTAVYFEKGKVSASVWYEGNIMVNIKKEIRCEEIAQVLAHILPPHSIDLTCPLKKGRESCRTESDRLCVCVCVCVCACLWISLSLSLCIYMHACVGACVCVCVCSRARV